MLNGLSQPGAPGLLSQERFLTRPCQDTKDQRVQLGDLLGQPGLGGERHMEALGAARHQPRNAPVTRAGRPQPGSNEQEGTAAPQPNRDRQEVEHERSQVAGV